MGVPIKSSRGIFVGTVELMTGVLISTGAFLLTGWVTITALRWIRQDIAKDLAMIRVLHRRLSGEQPGDPQNGN